MGNGSARPSMRSTAAPADPVTTSPSSPAPVASTVTSSVCAAADRSAAQGRETVRSFGRYGAISAVLDVVGSPAAGHVSVVVSAITGAKGSARAVTTPVRPTSRAIQV